MESCNLCGVAKLEIVYTPSGSEIDLQVSVCKNCGLVQGVYDVDEYERINDAVRDVSSKVSRLNCDAAYSDIRVGKQQMLKNAAHIIGKNQLVDNTQRVLDMRAARGDFVNYFNKLSPTSIIDAIEPDLYMAKEIAKTDRIKLISCKYKDWNPNYEYDLVYSCHTLEHFRDPISNLKYIRNLLSKDGYLILDVPNIDIISKTNNFDEYFYDKHLTYFNKKTLQKLLTAVGFETIEIENQGPCLYGLFKKTDDKLVPEIDQISVQESINLISEYKKEIAANRLAVSGISNRINTFLSNSDGKICFFGIGRLFDVFKSYGNLMTNDNTLLVDNYLSKATGELYGRKIFDQTAITDEIKNIILFTRPSDLKGELTNLYPKADVFLWSDFCDN